MCRLRERCQAVITQMESRKVQFNKRREPLRVRRIEQFSVIPLRESHPGDHTALKTDIFDGQSERMTPLLPMRVKQFTLAHPQGMVAFFGTPGSCCQLALDANELRTSTFATLVQPVGEHQSRSIVVMLLGNRAQEHGFVRIEHRLAPVGWPVIPRTDSLTCDGSCSHESVMVFTITLLSLGMDVFGSAASRTREKRYVSCRRGKQSLQKPSVPKQSLGTRSIFTNSPSISTIHNNANLASLRTQASLLGFAVAQQWIVSPTGSLLCPHLGGKKGKRWESMSPIVPLGRSTWNCS